MKASVPTGGQEAGAARLPRVSVCIPTYNGAASLERCLGSVLEQKGFEPGDVEIVLTDDRSSDTTSTILEHFGRLPAIRAYSNSRRLGLAANWQRALSRARGAIATVLHQDDWYEPDCLHSVIEVFDRDPRVAFAAFGQVFHYTSDERGIVFGPRARVGSFTGAEYAEYCLGFTECPAPSTAFIRRDRMSGLGAYYDARYRFCPEREFYVRLALANRDQHFVHDARLLVHRGAAEDRFSVRYPGYRVLDLCKMHVRHRDVLVADARRSAAEQLERQIASDLMRMFRRRDPKQIVSVFSDVHFLRWALRRPQHTRVVLHALGSAMRGAVESAGRNVRT